MWTTTISYVGKPTDALAHFVYFFYSCTLVTAHCFCDSLYLSNSSGCLQVSIIIILGLKKKSVLENADARCNYVLLYEMRNVVFHFSYCFSRSRLTCLFVCWLWFFIYVFVMNSDSIIYLFFFFFCENLGKNMDDQGIKDSFFCMDSQR